VIAALPPGYRHEFSHQARWLYRTLRSAELAGLDPAEAARSAIESRDLAGARDIASVIDARIRQRVYPLLPQPQGPWSEHAPELPDPDRQAYLAEIAAMMDARKQRLGEHAAETAPAWAVKALGPVPDDPAGRQERERKAASIGAYREIYGYHHPDDPIGPEPTHDSPRPARRLARNLPRARPHRRARRARHARRQAVAHPRHLHHRYPLGTPARRKELRLVRLGAANAELDAIRAGAEAGAARKADDQARAGRHEAWAASHRAMRDRYQAQEETFTKTMDDRTEWERATEHSRHLAVAADAELRRRHPDHSIEPLRSAEPAPPAKPSVRN
jgi:hypothetical protein